MRRRSLHRIRKRGGREDARMQCDSDDAKAGAMEDDGGGVCEHQSTKMSTPSFFFSLFAFSLNDIKTGADEKKKK